MNRALYDSLVRTVVPIIVGAVIGVLVSRGLVLDPEFETLLEQSLVAGFSAIYYTGARLLEYYVSPKFGWLLGLAKEPIYPDAE